MQRQKHQIIPVAWNEVAWIPRLQPAPQNSWQPLSGHSEQAAASGYSQIIPFSELPVKRMPALKKLTTLLECVPPSSPRDWLTSTTSRSQNFTRKFMDQGPPRDSSRNGAGENISYDFGTDE